jgi:hypothetical protein
MVDQDRTVCDTQWPYPDERRAHEGETDQEERALPEIVLEQDENEGTAGRRYPDSCGSREKAISVSTMATIEASI